MTDQVLEPTISIDADSYNPEQLEIYFEPNTDIFEINEQGQDVLKKDAGCAYDRLAKLRDAFLIYAERGVGKTHLLSLLGEQVKKQGGVYISLNPEDPGSPLRLIQKLKEDYPNLDTELLYKYILFDTLDKELSWRMTREIRKIGHSLNRTLDGLTWKVQAQIGFINIEQGKEKIQTNKDKSLANETGELQNRVEGLLKSLAKRKSKRTKSEHQRDILIRNLPKNRSVYVIIDKLDQAEKSKDTKIYQQAILNSLVGLIEAVKYINTWAGKNTLNLKVILSLRAITYLHSVSKDLTNQAQYDNMIFSLTWEPKAIERMLAKRILFASGLGKEKTVNEILNTRFPPMVHYFGKDFSTVSFLTEMAESRPRRIIDIWQKAVTIAHPNLEISPYDATLKQQDVITGLRQYSAHSLLNEVSQEHELDYPGIKDLFDHLHANGKKVSRFESQKNILEILQDFLASKKKKSGKSNPEWMNQNSEEILQILYDIGVVGITQEKLSLEIRWPSKNQVHFVETKSDVRVGDYEQFIFRPIFWHELTNFEDEIRERRKFISDLYEELLAILTELNIQIKLLEDDKGLINGQKLEFVFARYFALCNLIREDHEYPEPSDWAKWSSICGVINNSWSAFAISVLTENTDSEMHLSLVSGYALVGKPYVLRQGNQEKSKRISYLDFDEFLRIEKSSKYNELYEKISKYAKDKQYRTIKSLYHFRKIVFTGPDSLFALLQLSPDGALEAIENEQ